MTAVPNKCHGAISVCRYWWVEYFLLKANIHNFFSPASKTRSVCQSVFSVLERVVVLLTPPPWWVQSVLLAEQGSLWALVSLLFSWPSLLMGTGHILFGLVNKPVCIHFFLSSLMHFNSTCSYCHPNYCWWYYWTTTTTSTTSSTTSHRLLLYCYCCAVIFLRDDS